MQKKWLVTGAAGFIGSHLVEKLLELGQDVVGFDNFSQGKRENIEHMTKKFLMIEADLRDSVACAEACRGVDIVLHHAALCSVPVSMTEPMRAYSNNVEGFVNILNAAKSAGAKRFVYASSSAVYGDEAPDLPKIETMKGAPLSPYALSKWVNEEYAELYTRLYGMECVGLRYFNVFGTRQDPNGAYAAVIPRWLSALKNGEPVPIYGDGETTRDFCHVENVVEANVLAATTTNSEAFGQVFNIACAERTSLNELFAMLRDIAGQGGIAPSIAAPVYENFRAGDIRHSFADITKAKKILGYEPKIKIHEGLEKI